MTVSIQLHNTLLNISNELLPHYSNIIDEQGNIKSGTEKEKKSFLSALLKGILKSFIANSAEQLGGPLIEKVFGNMPPELLEKFLFKLLNGGKSDKFLQDGFIGESLEEFMSQGLEGMVDVVW